MFFRKKKNEMKMICKPGEEGICFELYWTDGKKQMDIPLPLSSEHIEQYYRLSGFISYIAWEELYEEDALDDGILSYETYYTLLASEDGRRILQTLGLPDEEMYVEGEVVLHSLPDEAKLELILRNEKGQNLKRIGIPHGAIYEIQSSLALLPQPVYALVKGLTGRYEHGYQKLAVCQKLAEEAGIQTDSFLQKEKFHLIETYDLDIKVHTPDHIELLPVGSSTEETVVLRQASPVHSFKEGMERKRYIVSGEVMEDMSRVKQKRHIYGKDVPVFLENPAAVLPEYDYHIDLEAFSERVRGLIPIQRIRPVYQEGTGMAWFDHTTGQAVEIDEAVLRTLMEQHPEEQYVQYNGAWVYLDPVQRKQFLADPLDRTPPVKASHILDIKDNEEQLEYEVQAADTIQVKQYPIPIGLQANLFDHQKDGFSWLCRLEEEGRGGLLADDMGLGKTIQVIAYLLHQQQKQNLSPSLIVLPIALIENWVEEIQKFAPSLSRSLYIHKGSGRLRSAAQIRQYDLVFTSYDTLKIDQLILGTISFRSIICDEAQNVKSFSSRRSYALRAMQGEFRLAMTGTPVENSLGELWAIMDFVQPGYLGSLQEFRKRYEEPEEYEALMEALKPYYLRRTKEEVISDRLPKKYSTDPLYVQASSVQKELARSMLQTKEAGQVAMLNMLMRMRQLYGHPGAIVPQYESLLPHDVPKLDALLSILERVREKNEKVIIFTEFRKLHAICKRLFMQQYGVPVPVIDGKTKNRQAIVRSFNESPGFGIMLLSPKAAGVGLTITSANHVVHYTRWWNPAVENQATDRAYRIGQKKDVYVYHLITTDRENFPNGTVEELMHILLAQKQELAQNVIIPFDLAGLQQEVMRKMNTQ